MFVKTDEQMAKDYLQKIKELNNVATAIMEEVEFLQTACERTTPQYSSFIHGGTGTHTDKADIIARLMDARGRCNAAIDTYADYKANCQEMINSLPNPIHRSILTLRYVQNKKFKEINKSLNYERRHGFRLHQAALAAFAQMHGINLTQPEQKQ